MYSPLIYCFVFPVGPVLATIGIGQPWADPRVSERTRMAIRILGIAIEISVVNRFLDKYTYMRGEMTVQTMERNRPDEKDMLAGFEQSLTVGGVSNLRLYIDETNSNIWCSHSSGRSKLATLFEWLHQRILKVAIVLGVTWEQEWPLLLTSETWFHILHDLSTDFSLMMTWELRPETIRFNFRTSRKNFGFDTDRFSVKSDTRTTRFLLP